MEVCSRNHEEIVYHSGYNNCPLCARIKEIEILQDLKYELETEIEDLKDEIEDLNIQLNKND